MDYATLPVSTPELDKALLSANRAGPKLGSRQVALARQMYDETGDDGKRAYTVAQIAAEFGVTRPTIYRHLAPRQNDYAPTLITGRTLRLVRALRY